MTKREVPTYETDDEIAAARAMHGTSYDRMVARKQISAPSTEELPQAELEGRMAKHAERSAAAKKGAKKARRTRAKKSAE